MAYNKEIHQIVHDDGKIIVFTANHLNESQYHRSVYFIETYQGISLGDITTESFKSKFNSDFQSLIVTRIAVYRNRIHRKIMKEKEKIKKHTKELDYFKKVVA